MGPSNGEFDTVAREALALQSAWARERFSLPGLDVSLRITRVPRTYLGHARVVVNGRREITRQEITLASHGFTNYETQGVAEYHHFNDDPTIGGFYTNDWRLGVQTLIAHELSHVVQFSLKHHGVVNPRHALVSSRVNGQLVFGMLLGGYNDNHGSFFQNIYALFRNQWINDQVTALDGPGPRSNFKDFSLMPSKGPLTGVRFEGKHGEVEILGRHVNPFKRLWCYQIRYGENVLEAQLGQLYRLSSEVREIVDAREDLALELHEHRRRLAAQHDRLKLDSEVMSARAVGLS